MLRLMQLCLSPWFFLCIFPISSAANYGSTEDNRNFPLECKEILDRLARSSSVFTSCMLEKSQPWFSSCLSCAQHYQQMQSIYSQLQSSPGNQSVSCYDVFFYGAKINLLEEVYLNAVGVWKKPYCLACFEKPTDSNGELTLKNTTLKFFDRFDTYATCRNRYEKNASQLCQECRPAYERTKKLVTKRFESGLESTCIDVTDTWNKTQREWSVRFGCHIPATDTFLLGAFTSFILLLPLIFYLSVYLNSEHKRQTFDKMKRASTSAVMSDTEFEGEDEHEQVIFS